MMASEITLDEKFLELQNAKKPTQNSHPKIQKVPQNLRNRNKYDKHYSPKAVSIGPIHHNNKNLKIGDNYKLTLAAKYIRNTQHTPQFLHKKIADNISKLMGLFADDVLALVSNSESLQGFCSDEEKLSWLLFVDGCFLLCILDFDNFQFVDDEDMSMKFTQLLVQVMTDMLLLENQLPYLVLKLLWKNDNEKELIDKMYYFLQEWDMAIRDDESRRMPGILEKLCTIFQKTKQKPAEDLPNEPQPPIHLLDLQRKKFLTKSKSNLQDQLLWENPNLRKLTRYRNIEELTAIGIRLKSSGTRMPFDVDLSEGWFAAELILPEIVVDDITIASFLNLTAYEMCPDFENDYGICSFVVFMDSLIDHAEDVKQLRLEGILGNLLGRDEEVVDLFNIISSDLENNSYIYREVKNKIHEHRLKKCKIWLALGYHTYFSNPWAIIGLIAGVIALVLTFLQTWFSIKPR